MKDLETISELADKYNEINKPQVVKPPVKTMELHSFLDLAKDLNSTEIVKKYSNFIMQEDLTNSYVVNTVLHALYSWAELKGYREGLSEGRDIAGKYDWKSGHESEI